MNTADVKKKRTWGFSS